MKVCTSVKLSDSPPGQYCMCECHARITAMCESVGMERTIMGNPEYEPYVRGFWMPGLDGVAQSDAINTRVRRAPRDPVGAVIKFDEPDVTFEPLPNGNLRPGQLEYWVNQQVRAWAYGYLELDHCTPPLIAQTIAEVYGVKVPSQGAVRAVMDRWEKLGYCLVASGPFRVTALTPEGMARGLDGLRAAASA
jgi:hypothetical protein